MFPKERPPEVTLLDKLSPYTGGMEMLLSKKQEIETSLEKTSKSVKSALNAYFSYREEAKPTLEAIEKDYINGRCAKYLRDASLEKHETRCLGFGNEIRIYYKDINEWKKDILKINSKILELGGMIEALKVDNEKEFNSLSEKSQELISSYILEAQKIKLEAEKIAFLNTHFSFLDTHFLLFTPPSAKQSTKSSILPQEKLDSYPTTPEMGHSKGG